MKSEVKLAELHLLEKTELFIENIQLDQVNLTQVAGRIASVIGLESDEVAVIDVRAETMALDILRPTLNLQQIAGKRREILAALGTIDGITVREETTLHSEGILGLVNLSEEQVPDLGGRVDKINQQMQKAVRARAIIFPTGQEVIERNIEDTNTPFLTKVLTDLGCKVTKGRPLEDSLEHIIGALHEAVDMGYGLVITTGGVGAEDKDHIVEAILALDSKASTPYIVHYTAGHGRHKKGGVRIAVGRLDWTTLVALPGPHDEVQIAAPILAQGILEKWDKTILADKLVQPLRAKLIRN